MELEPISETQYGFHVGGAPGQNNWDLANWLWGLAVRLRRRRLRLRCWLVFRHAKLSAYQARGCELVCVCAEEDFCVADDFCLEHLERCAE